MAIPSQEDNAPESEELKAAVLQLHIQLFSAASSRSRASLYLVIGACVLLFAAAWNSRPSGWMTQRLGTAQGAFQLMSEMEVGSAAAERASPPMAAESGANTADARVSHTQSSTSAEVQSKRAYDIAHSQFAAEQRWTVEDVERYLGYIERGGFRRAEDIQRHIDMMREAKITNVQSVRVPFVGISFDVNDIGLIGGLTLTIFMVVYWFNLKRERDLLRILDENLVERLGISRAHMYWLLNGTQVLQVPPGGSVLRERDMRAWLPRFLFFVPILTQAFVILNDVLTLRIGMMLSFGSTILTLALATLFLGILVALTGLCLHVSSQIEEIWEDRYKLWTPSFK